MPEEETNHIWVEGISTSDDYMQTTWCSKCGALRQQYITGHGLSYRAINKAESLPPPAVATHIKLPNSTVTGCDGETQLTKKRR